MYASTYAPFEVVVVENASTDGTPELLQQHFPQVCALNCAVNLGHTGGFNFGIQHVRGDLVLLLDADTEFDADLIGALVTFMATHPGVAVAAPRLYYADGALQETARNFPSAMSGLFGRQSALTRWFPNNRFSRSYLLREKLHENEAYAVQSLSSACMIFPTSLIGEVGAWDESYPGYWVDVDWCFKLHGLGKKLVCLPQLRMVHHEGNRRLRRRGARRIWMFNFGAFLLYRKHYTRGTYDPRAVLALGALVARTIAQVLEEAVRFGRFGRSARPAPNHAGTGADSPTRHDYEK